MTDTSKRSRVQAGVPTGGEFATEARAENDDLRLSDFVDDDAIAFARETLGPDADEDTVRELATERGMAAYEEYRDGNGQWAAPKRDYEAENAEILGLIKQHAKWGLLHNNGLGTYLGEVTLARTDLGLVTADIAIHPYEARRDEEGNPIEQCWALNIFPHKPISATRSRTVSLEEALAVPATKVGLRRAGRDELIDLVGKYDRNVMQQGTARQQGQYAAIFAEEVGTKEFANAEARNKAYLRSQDRARAEIPEDNGHWWGDNTDKMVRPIPPQDFKRILELLDEAKTSKAMRKPD